MANDKNNNTVILLYDSLLESDEFIERLVHKISLLLLKWLIDVWYLIIQPFFIT